MTDNRKIIKETIIFSFLFIFASKWGIFSLMEPIYWGDFIGQWQLSAYTLSGVNPFPLVGIDKPFISAIGAIPNGWGTTPWGLILGNILYAGFLQLDSAKFFFIIINVFLLCSLIILIQVTIKELNLGWRFFIAAMIFVSYDFWLPIFGLGNGGSAICIFLLITCICCEKHPFLSGIALAFGMIKPQTALPIALSLLLLKQIKPIIIAAIIDISAWILAAMKVKRGFFFLLRDFFSLAIGDGAHPSKGLFTIFSDHFGNYQLTFICSMIFGIILLIIFTFLIDEKFPIFIKLLPASVVSIFWCHSSGNEYFILIYPAIVTLIILKYSQSWSIKIITAFIAAYCYYHAYIITIINIITALIVTQYSKTEWWYKKHFSLFVYSIILIILFIIFIFKTKQQNEKKNICI